MRPARKVAALIAGSALGAVIGLALAEQLEWASGTKTALAAAIATGLCVTTAAATLVFAETVFDRAPLLGPVAVLLGTGMRMTVAVVGVVMLGEALKSHGIPPDEFARWVAYLYIVTLALECGLLMTGRQPGATR
ncbi:hypothetical protein R5W24_005534 [Gemmata sp. JC717]|uniref:Uncharacterized protein n=1 Tax=Gemmata algarum TaxID=2975278 RepID=A0ABU5EUC4_9BACT|nr:hypothetical protein [Gemmata algarum]MDY3556369.1 hypothetical protein [Gemmata algarum]MDY3558045.1 hypothetical protein [Gemmata algarum]